MEIRSLLPLEGKQAGGCLKVMVVRLLARGVEKGLIVKFLSSLKVPEPESYITGARKRFGMKNEEFDLAEEFISPALWKIVSQEFSLNGDGSTEFVYASDIEYRKLDWLWYPRLLRRALSLLEGPPDKGKSTILCELAARESRGHSFPGETKGRPPGFVVMLSAEDDLEATVMPRLTAAGADLKRIRIAKATRDDKGQPVPFHISDDLKSLRKECLDRGATMVTIDPLVSYLGSRYKKSVETNSDMEVRKSLLPLKELSEDINAVVIAVRHYRKGRGTDAIEAGGGSIAFTGLSRVLLSTLPDPFNSEQYLLSIPKNNLVKKSDRAAFVYKIVPSDHDPTIGRILWGEEVSMSTEEILVTLSESKKEANSSSAVADAKAFLLEALASREWVLATDVQDAGGKRGITVRILGIARKKLGVEVQKKDHWYWRLPVAKPANSKPDLF